MIPTPRLRSFRLPRSLTVLGAVAVLALAGCASEVKLDETPVVTRATVTTPAAPTAGGATATTGAAPSSQVATVDLSRGAGAAEAAGAAAGADGLPANLPRVVYFDYDSYVVRDDAKPVLEAYARALAAQKARRMIVEGHTDERGGAEYNLALGQRRAEAVVRALVLMGAGEGQLEAVSFGKERPADTGGNEEAWARNRRAELRAAR